ncbi:hypothetical protein N7530_007593 [Penicillium desertorum]|uniref:Ankyrin repeat protein n=1 Tax=Penicillium desertorum TaxID=1303715 RepID=A0A9W9WMK9_9EURO|nr:hypothetical protein N7530_007593 [Penicillium desertorum]
MACYIEPPHREPMLDLLLEYGADIELEDSTGETLLFEFTDGKNNDLIRELCKRGAKVNYQNFHGETALHICHSSEETVKALLESGAEVDVPNLSGRTPLTYHNDIPVMKELLAHGADPDFSDILGDRPLLAFILYGNYEAVELLIDHGADPTYTVEDGSNYTYLHAAAIVGHPDILKLPLKYEADIGAQIDMGQRPGTWQQIKSADRFFLNGQQKSLNEST